MVSLPSYASETTPEIETAMQQIKPLFEQYVKLRGWETIARLRSQGLKVLLHSIAAVRMEEDPAKFTDTIAANLQLSIEETQGLLEIFDPAERLNRIGVLLELEIKKLQSAMIEGRTCRQSHSSYKYEREWVEIMMKSAELHRAKLPDWQIPRDGQVSILVVYDPRGGHSTLPGHDVVLQELAEWIRSNRPGWNAGRPLRCPARDVDLVLPVAPEMPG